MKRNLMQFLFGESQVDEELATIVEDIADMDTEGATTVKVEKAPLAKALKELGIDAEGLENDPRGLSLVFGDGESYRAAHAILNEPDSLHKLASAGWVYSTQGDVAMNNEPAEFRIRFLEIDNVEPSEEEPKPTKGTAKNKKLSDVIKKAREFATKKPEHDDMNPVEFDDKTSSNRRKGMSKEKDGAQPEGSPKTGLSTKPSGSKPGKGDLTQPSEGDSAKMTESDGDYTMGCPTCGNVGKYFRGGVWRCNECTKPLPSGPLENPSRGVAEGKHKAGCQCGFCKNKGNIHKRGKEKEEAEGSGEEAEMTEGYKQVEVDYVDSKTGKSRKMPFIRKEKEGEKEGEKEKAEESAEAIVGQLLDSNPGTPPGIMGHKSYPTMKVPGGSKDRKFRPAQGMVQPTGDTGSIVNKQAK